MTVSRSAAPSTVVAPVSTAARWLPTLVLLALAVLLFAIGFHREASDAVRVWLQSTAYNHCFLILPIVGYLLWERRSVIRASAPHATLWPLLLIPPLVAVWFVAAALDINEGRQLLVVAMFEVVLLAALGPQVYRSLLAPLLFLFFLVPTGAFLVPELQRITARMAVAGLRLFHVPVFADRYTIDIPEGNFVIAEACAGLRFLIAASVFSCLFAVVMYRSWLRRAFYIALSIPAAIAANGVRAWGIIMLAHLLGSATAAETDHILYGWLFFSLVIALLIGIGLLMTEKSGPAVPDAPQPIPLPAPRWHALAVPLAALLALGGPAYATWRDRTFDNNSLAVSRSPAVAAVWHAVPGTNSAWRPEVHGADRIFLQSFNGPDGAVVTRFVALYRLRTTGGKLTSTDNRIAGGRQWRIVRQQRRWVTLDGTRMPVVETEIVSGARRRLVWSFYIADGRISAGIFHAKLFQLRALFAAKRPVGALVAIATPLASSDRTAEARLAQFLVASQPFPSYMRSLQSSTGGDAE
jgi:exosortase A